MAVLTFSLHKQLFVILIRPVEPSVTWITRIMLIISISMQKSPTDCRHITHKITMMWSVRSTEVYVIIDTKRRH